MAVRKTALMNITTIEATNIDAAIFPYAVDVVTILQAHVVNPAVGLKADEVLTRRREFGANALQTIRQRSWVSILLDQFLSLIIALLAAAALIAWATGDTVEALAIAFVLVFNGLVGFATEWQAGRALDALRRQSRTTARVRRDGKELELDATDLVPGDVVILNAGDGVPADARLLEASNLRIEESALTGESATVEKNITPVSKDALLAERHAMLYLGTAVVAGRGVAIVTATGTDTELGKIGKLVASAPNETTPLKRRLDELGRRLVYAVLAIGAIVMLTGWWRGESLWLMAEVGISLAVAAIPEALPAVTTLILALGVLRMARQNAIVRRLPAVETLGSATIICTDKTGTLTENRMTVRDYFLASGEVVKLTPEMPVPENNELLTRALRISVLCNEASFNQQETDEAQTVGDPTETALLVAAHKTGMDIVQTRLDYPKLSEIPFAAVTKRMLTLHQTKEGVRLVALKGGPSAVLDICTQYAADGNNILPLDEAARKTFLVANEAMAERGLRVLALAEKRLNHNDEAEISDARMMEGYCFLGFVGMSDPPRAEVPAALASARQAGIRVVMLTGDQINTARAIAKELRLNGAAEPRALHARDLIGADHALLAQLADSTDVFARVSPEDKLNIVAALQQAHEIVAVTGDGVNDAPALKRADIGIAMGKRGTEVAKEAADMVLADDNFATIIKAVAGGRTIYANIIKFVHLMFSKNLAAVIAIFVAIVVGWPLPLLPLQILWLNLVTDIFPALALALEPSGAEVMQRPPRSSQAALLSRPFVILILWQAVMLAAIILAGYAWALRTYGGGAHARTVALLTLVGVQLGHTFNCRSRTRSAFADLFSNPFLWLAAAIVMGLQLLAIYLPPLARVLATTPLTKADFVVTVIAISLPILIVEAAKFIAQRKR